MSTVTLNYYCSASPDNRLSVTAVSASVPSNINAGALNETVEIPKLLHTTRAFIPPEVHLGRSAPA